MNDYELNKEILDFLIKVPEFYYLEDYGNYTIIQILNTDILSKKRGKPENYISLVFF